MKTKNLKAPEHNVLGSESVLNHHLTEIVQLAVVKELRYQMSRLHALLSDGDEECTTMFDERIFELDPENKTADNPKTSVSKPKSKKGNKHPAFVLPKGFELPEEVEPFVNGLKWNIDRNEISAIVVGCGLNRQYGVKTKHTAMFFPKEEDAFLNVEGIFEAMMLTTARMWSMLRKRERSLLKQANNEVTAMYTTARNAIKMVAKQKDLK